MKVSLPFGSLLLALLLWSPAATRADTRMQVAVDSTPVLNQAGSGGQSVGTVASGEILFVSRVDGDWAAISPPERFTLWLNKDFIEGNRVIAKVIQVRSGPGIEHPVVGTLKRGAPVMPRGEDGEWCKIAPPSSCLLWVKKQDLTEVKARTTPIREVKAVAEPKKPAPVPPKPVSTTPVGMATPAPKPAPKPKSKPAPKPTVATPGIQTADRPPPRSPSRPKVVPSKPKAATPKSARRTTTTASTPRTAPVTSAQTPKPVPAALRPATALPTQPQPPKKKTVRRKRKARPTSTAVPTPTKTVAKPKKQKLDVQVDPVLVEDLDLADVPNQGKSVQVEGEVRNAPFLTASPSRYRLLDYDGRVLEMVCHLHGDSAVLRQFVGKGVSIRGREYWVETSDMPVVVVGEIIPLVPTGPASEPVLF